MSPAELVRRLQLLFTRNRRAQELEDEMRTHLQYRAESFARGGSTNADAGHAARRRFGNALALQETSQDAWGFGSFDMARRDIRHAVRRMRRRPALSLAVVTVMALGIGATTAMFSAVDAAMLRPLPFANADRLVSLTSIVTPSRFDDARSDVGHSVSLDLHDIENMRDMFSGSAVYAAGGLNLTDAERPLRVQTGVVTSGFFTLLGIAPLHGRAFLDSDGKPESPHVVVLSHAIWKNHFGGRDMIGTSVPLNGTPYQVIGIMPQGFSFPSESDVWIPMSVPITMATFEPFRGYLASTTLARVASNVSIDQVATRLLARWTQALARDTVTDHKARLAEQLQGFRTDGVLVPLQRSLVGDRRTALLVLLGATGLLLLIACANVTNLMLSQAALRQREIAVRAVLGASRAQIVRQLLIESVMLAACGAALGLALAPLVLKVLTVLTPRQLAGLAPAHLDLRVLLFATVTALLTGIGFGLWPALGGTRMELGATIKSGSGHGATSRSMGRTRKVLVGAEVALTVMLLIGAGLMLRSFRQLVGLDTGMAVDHTATLQMSFPRGKGEIRLQRINEMVDRLSAMPGIEAAGVVNDLPLTGGGMAMRVLADGVAPSKDLPFVRYLIASNGYFRALGITLLRGRVPSTTGDSVSKREVVVNTAMVKAFWPNSEPLGRTFHFDPDTVRYRVVGIVHDMRAESLDEPSMAQAYFSVFAMQPTSVSLVARGSLSPVALMSRLTQAVHAVDPSQAVYRVRMMTDVVSGSVAPRRANTILISAFAALAFVLAALGVYAVVDYNVAQRTREFGIRSALGASGRDLLQLVASDMVLVVSVGIALGVAGAWMLSHVLESLLYGVTTHDLTTFVVVPVMLAVCAAMAAVWPARKAMIVNPSDVMRAD